MHWSWLDAGVFLLVLGFFFAAGEFVSPFRRLSSSSKNEIESFCYRLLIVVVFVTAAVVAVIVIKIMVVSWPTNVNAAAALGQRGDFFGGFINPFLTFIAFVGFLHTVRLQREEINTAKEQAALEAIRSDNQSSIAREQAYQSAFFQMLGNHNDLVNAISVKDSVRNDATVAGRAAFRTMYSSLRRTFRERLRRYSSGDRLKVLAISYERFYREFQFELGHYFRSLYNTVKLLEDGPDSEKYIKMLIAQLSNQELLVLYYNCAISEHGDKFRKIAERHQLFQNMPPHLLEFEHSHLLSPQVFGDGGYERIVASLKRPLRS